VPKSTEGTFMIEDLILVTMNEAVKETEIVPIVPDENLKENLTAPTPTLNSTLNLTPTPTITLQEPLPLCQALGDEIDGTWINGWWTPKNCIFKKYSKQKARKCISGKTIVFIGDSTSRELWEVSFLLIFFSFSFSFSFLFFQL